MTNAPNQRRRIFEAIDSLAEDENPERMFLQTVDSDDQPLVLSGNTEGLVWLARQLLSLAERQSPQSHIHLSADSPFDHCDRPLVLRFEPAPWDEPTTPPG